MKQKQRKNMNWNAESNVNLFDHFMKLLAFILLKISCRVVWSIWVQRREPCHVYSDCTGLSEHNTKLYNILIINCIVSSMLILNRVVLLLDKDISSILSVYIYIWFWRACSHLQMAWNDTNISHCITYALIFIPWKIFIRFFVWHEILRETAWTIFKANGGKSYPLKSCYQTAGHLSKKSAWAYIANDQTLEKKYVYTVIFVV